MRGLAGRDQVQLFMRRLGAAVAHDTQVYLAGGATAILFGWRDTTIDIDLTFMPERDEVFRAIANLKDQLGINVELAVPSHFIPEVPGWESRSPFIAREGKATFHHYDLYSQALAKIERGHAQDRIDVGTMIDRGLVDRGRLRELFSAIEPQLYRFPAVDATGFKAAVLDATAQ